MKNIVALSLLCLSSAAFADKVCWDGTFGYNYARVVDTADGLDISVQGGNLNLPTLNTGSGTGLTFGNFSASRPELHIVLPKSAVKTENGTTIAQFSGSIADTFDDQKRALWVEHSAQDLDKSVAVISSIPLLSLKAVITDDAIKIDFTQLWAYTKQGKNLNSKLIIPCQHESAPDDLRVPERLKQFLNSRN